MIDMFDLLLSLRANVNPQQAGHIRPQQNFVRWVNQISHEIFDELAKQWEKNQVLSDKLSPFLKSVSVTLAAQPGQPFDIFAAPADYRYFSSARFQFAPGGATGMACENCCLIDGSSGKEANYQDEDDIAQAKIDAGSNYREVPVKKVDNMRWGSALQHRFKGPSADHPLITAMDERRFKVAPRGLGIMVLDYLRKPKDATFAYTLGSDDQIIYDASNSIPLEWDTNVLPEFLARLGAKYGVFVREDFVYQASELAIAQTKS